MEYSNKDQKILKKYSLVPLTFQSLYEGSFTFMGTHEDGTTITCTRTLGKEESMNIHIAEPEYLSRRPHEEWTDVSIRDSTNTLIFTDTYF